MLLSAVIWLVICLYISNSFASVQSPQLNEAKECRSRSTGIIPISNYSTVALARDGIYLLPTDDDTVSGYLLAFGEFEYPYVEVIMKLFPRPAEDDAPLIFLDIGANVGAWSIPLAKHIGPKSMVFAFEALYETSLFLSANVAINGLQNIVVKNVAVTDRAGVSTTIFHPHDGKRHNLGSFGLRHMEIALEHSESAGFERRLFSTPNVMLDTLYDDNVFSCPDFIKMDIELHELHALRGGMRMLRECHPMLFLEHNCLHLSRSIITLLDKLGYAMAWFLAPMVSADRTHFGRSLKTHIATPNEYLAHMTGGFEDGGVNILAVPKPRAGAIFSDPQFAENIIPIHMGYFDIAEYNVEVCVDTIPRKCRVLKLEGDADDPLYLCAGIDMLPENVNYWKVVESEDFNFEV